VACPRGWERSAILPPTCESSVREVLHYQNLCRDLQTEPDLTLSMRATVGKPCTLKLSNASFVVMTINRSGADSKRSLLTAASISG
jgi:hypothetical protein